MPFWNRLKKEKKNPHGPSQRSQRTPKNQKSSRSPSPAYPKMQNQPQPQSRSKMQPPQGSPGPPRQQGNQPQQNQQGRAQPQQQQQQYPRQQNQPGPPTQQQSHRPQQNQHGRGNPQKQQGYLPQQRQQQGPPPQQQGYPPQQGHQQGPPPQQGYPSQQRQQQGPPPQQQGYAPQQGRQQGGPPPQQGYPPQQYQQQGGPPPRPQSNYVGGHPSPGLQSSYVGGYAGGPMPQAPMGAPMVGMQPPALMAPRGGAVLMPAPALIPGIPNGLEYLAAIDHIIVDQLVEMIELISNIEGANAYSLKNAFGQQAYFAMEESNPMMRQMMGKERQFTMRITDNWQREVIRVHRPFKQFGMPIDACFIECPLGVQIGRVVLQGFIAPLTLTVEDSFCRPMFIINGPICPMGNYGDQIFPITCTQTMQQVGAITKKFGGMAKEMYTDADTFVVNFPMMMDVYMKACIIGANFLIDFLLYEDNHKQPGGMMMLR